MITNLHLQSPCFHPNHFSILPKPHQICEFRVWRRRTLKFERKRISKHVQCQFSDNLNSLYNFVSQFPSLYLIAPTLGLASGVSLYISQLNKSNQNLQLSDTGEWILFTNPTPFNRFVLLRCPSITFEGSELLEDLNHKLVTENRHYVKINNQRIQDDNEKYERKLVYQRVCVTCEDGGVISLDWPANLDLRNERGMDTTMLLVPGTALGSMDKNVRLFVCDSLKRGYFPVVMNPRGCAGSPLTTARLFTAADSDDICTAIQFINNARPWTTMMAVGWGYGANMLTKYLAEVGERTPLTAVTCIDNPFDLEEVTRSSPHHIALDQKLISGLVDILRSNRKLFQGRAKGFNVEKALEARTVRDFESEISMSFYGFEAIEEFYSKSSTRELVGSLKVPVLFIQSDDGTVPPFSIPRSSIAENPFISLLLYSCLPADGVTSKVSQKRWCQHFAFEWLTAVELGLLKGRHPILEDVDVTLNPSKGLELVEGSALDNNVGFNKLNALNGNPNERISSRHDVSDTSATLRLGSWRPLLEGAESREDDSEMVLHSSSVDAELVEETGDTPIDNDSQVLQTAQVVMNMLDVTMPGTLAEEQKKKVLSAMEQGDTLMKALQGAVPEDVRGKLTASVSEIMHKKNLDGLSSFRPPDLIKMGNEISVSADKKFFGSDRPAKELESDSQPSQNLQESDSQPSQNLQKSLDQGQSQSESIQGKGEFSRDDENGSVTESKPNNHGRDEKAVESDVGVGTQDIINQGDGMAQLSTHEANGIQKNEEKILDNSIDQESLSLTAKTDEVAPAVSSLEPPVVEKRPDHLQQSDDQSVQRVEEDSQTSAKPEEPVPSPLPTSNPPSISMSQAFDALTGFDDSTQVAVNSVFGVIEGMIDQLEEGNGQEDSGKKDESRNGKPSSTVQASLFNSETECVPINEEHVDNRSEFENVHLNPHTNEIQTFSEKFSELNQDASKRGDEKHLSQSFAPHSNDNADVCHGIDVTNHADNDKDVQRKKKFDSNYSGENLDKLRRIEKVPLYVTVNPYGDSMYNEYLRQYLLAKIPNAKSLDLDSTTCLWLDYFPEDGQWKLLDRLANNRDSVGNIGTQSTDGRSRGIQSLDHPNNTTEIIETSYVVLNNDNEQKPIKEYKATGLLKEKSEQEGLRSEEMVKFVKNIVLDSLKVEVCRRLGMDHLKQLESGLAHDLKQVAEEVSLAVGHSKELTRLSNSNESAPGKVGTLDGEHVIKKISSAVKDASYLRKVLPVGVIVGSILASLRKDFIVVTQHDNGHLGATMLSEGDSRGKQLYDQVGKIQNVEKLVSKKSQYFGLESSRSRINERPQSVNNNTVMVGAVTAAVGASALFVHQQGKDPYTCNGSAEFSTRSLSGEVSQRKDENKVLDVVSEKNQTNIVSDLAEKAMSVAGPVVPTTSGGKVDQERLVALLADWGQKGGMLRLIGKLALLWGGIRGAMSLTERLISFLHIADRPLFQRILGFACMVLVLWSPVVIPLFPTLVQSWATHNFTGISVYASIIGLYIALLILIMIWGRRIRGYTDPFLQYGLDLTSLTKISDFSKGLIGGVTLVLSIHSLNVLLGYAHFSWSSSLPSSRPDVVAWLRVCGRMLIMAGRGFFTASVVAIVEELLFRSWLPEEIAVDLGYHRAVIISGFAFAILQRSPGAIPGLWLLSLALSGARERGKGSLSVPIGMHTGIVASSFILNTGGFLTYHPHFPHWLIGEHPLQPFSGAVGMTFCLLLAILLYPRQPRPVGRPSKKSKEIVS